MSSMLAKFCSVTVPNVDTLIKRSISFAMIVFKPLHHQLSMACHKCFTFLVDQNLMQQICKTDGAVVHSISRPYGIVVGA